MTTEAVVRKNNLLPLDAIPERAILVTDAYSEELMALKKSLARIEGYFMVRDTSDVQERFKSTFKLQNLADSVFDLDGNWFLGRTHQYGESLRVIVNINDPLTDYPIRRCLQSQLTYSVNGLKEVYRGMNIEGSKNFHGTERDYRWRCILDAHPGFDKFMAVDAHRIPGQAPL